MPRSPVRYNRKSCAWCDRRNSLEVVTMSTRKTTFFYALLIAVASLAVGMVLASRLDLTPASSAQPAIAVPAMNSAPITGAIDAQTFRNIAKSARPMVVNIQTEMKAKGQDLTDFFGGGGSPDDLFH